MYVYDNFGWYAGEGEGPRSTSVEPSNKSLTEVEGELRANFTGYVWIDTPYKVIEIVAPIEVPQIITKLQAMKQMKVIGKWETFKAFLATDEDINDEWLLSDNLDRNYPLVLGVGQLFEYTSEQLDTFFIEASKL